MMKCLSHLLSTARWPERGERDIDPSGGHYVSIVWKNSRVMHGVEYAVRRASVGQRIELVRRTRELTLQNEFLRAGVVPDQLNATLADLYVWQMYLEWGLAGIKGLTIDGQIPTASLLVEKGPESLCHEIVEAIQCELNLGEEERKNS